MHKQKYKDIQDVCSLMMDITSYGASLVDQSVKSLPAVQETQAPSLGREDPLEKEKATHSSILAWRNPMDRRAWWATVHRVTKSWT